MDRTERIKLFGLIIVLAGLLFLATLPGGGAKADGAGGFPTSTAVIIVFPTVAPSPTAPMILNNPTQNPYPFPLPENNSLNMMLPESQAEPAVIPEEGGIKGISTYFYIPIIIVVVIMAFFGVNRIRKNYQDM